MVINIILILLFIIGIFFSAAGVIGILRMPDVLCRLQASTNIATMGVMPIILGCSIYGFSINNISLGIKSLILLFFLVITNPIASHVLARSASKEISNSLGEEK